MIEHLQRLFTVGVASGSLPDGQLLNLFVARREGEAAQAEAEAAFSALIDRHGPMVLRVCRQVLGNHDDAQDAAQIVFVVLASRARSIRCYGSLASWLHGVALRTSAKARTAAARRRGHERLVAENRPRAVEGRTADDEPSWQEVHEELGQLPEKFREPILLCHLEGLTREMAAKKLGWPVGTVQSRLARGQKQLRSRLLRRGVTLSAGLAALGSAVPAARAAMTSAWQDATLRAAARHRDDTARGPGRRGHGSLHFQL